VQRNLARSNRGKGAYTRPTLEGGGDITRDLIRAQPAKRGSNKTIREKRKITRRKRTSKHEKKEDLALWQRNLKRGATYRGRCADRDPTLRKKPLPEKEEPRGEEVLKRCEARRSITTRAQALRERPLKRRRLGEGDHNKSEGRAGSRRKGGMRININLPKRRELISH